MVYKEAPWIFKGRAIYQLQLVKANEARKHIPDDFKLVEFFGYTLGGFYLARYEDSPVGAFDECVAMAGLVWNPPTSCAWAARVYVSNREARDHGLQHVGLPSRFAAFRPAPAAEAAAVSSSSRGNWWNPKGSDILQDTGEQLLAQRGRNVTPSSSKDSSSSRRSSSSSSTIQLFNSERGGRGLADDLPVCSFVLPEGLRTSGALGPRLRLALPSFSGGTVDHPGLLQYSCDLATSIMPVAPLKVILPRRQQQGDGVKAHSQQQLQQQHPELLDSLLSGKPLVALAFSNMEMTVQEPTKLILQESMPERQMRATGPPLACMLAWGPGLMTTK